MYKICHIGTHMYTGGAEIFLAAFSENLKKSKIVKSIILHGGNYDDCFAKKMPFPVVLGGYEEIKKISKEVDLFIHWGQVPLNDMFQDRKKILTVFFAFTEFSGHSLNLCKNVTSHVIAVSKNIKNKVCLNLEIPVSMIWPSADCKRIQSNKTKEEARNFFGLSNKSFVIGYAGSLFKNKRVDILINSIVNLNNCQILIVGNGPELNNLKNGNSNIFFREEIQDIGIFYKAIDVFCLCSESEGGPNVMWEAMSCGIPFIGTSVGLVPEVVQHKVNGFIIDRCELSILEAVQFLNNQKNYDLLQNNGYTTFNNKGNFEKCARNLENELIKIIKKNLIFL